jgi:hemoglobin
MPDHGHDEQDLHPETVRLLSRRQVLGTAGKAAAVTLFGVFTVSACRDSTTTASGSTSTGGPATKGGGGAATSAVAPRTAAPGSLYTRLGGNAAITAVVGTFLQNVVNDARINRFFANTNAQRLQVLLVEQIGQATGGPEVCSGKDMKSAHANMAITVADFNAMVEDLITALDQHEVPAAEKQELLSALATMQPDIVTA